MTGMRPVPMLVEQAAERVLHRAGGRREHVRLHRRQVDDVLADEALRDHEALRVDLVQAGELLRQIADRVTDVDPLLGLVDVDVAQAVRFDDVDLLVLALAEMGVDDDRAVVARVDQRRVVAVLLHRADDAVELPRRRRAARKEEMPGDVDLERRVGVFRDDVLVAGQVHQLVIVPEHGCRDCRARMATLAFGMSMAALDESGVTPVEFNTRAVDDDRHGNRPERDAEQQRADR